MNYYQHGNIRMFNGDSMEFMANVPDKHYELAIIDPPYGIRADKPALKRKSVVQKNGTLCKIKQAGYLHKEWDAQPFDKEHWKMVENVSKNQIVWGCNFFNFQLPGGRIIWDKLNEGSDQHDVEIAYCSITNRTDIVYYLWRGMMQGRSASKNVREALIQMGDKRLNEKRIHPTQKPVAIYRWLLENYAKPGDKILDTHGGSGSIVIACHALGFELDWVELDHGYYDAAVKRFKEYIGKPEEMGGHLWDAPPQLKLFSGT